ncbi:polysaccharide deacetylase [Colletotrichum chrysophilum]|uniref:Polysaccharide deacetylase n=2 Tax=Colletotrichum chrysophilum TaxID=1836956 RepID=A0AAD9E7T4_9PEZI|nr:polysaccharide deacetylase [Colletotrichum chrysophilum]
MSSTLLRLLGLAGAAQAACSNLVIDNFSRSTVSGSNNLDAWTSEDTSMSKVAISKGILSFTPKTDSSSYYYETLGCVKAATQGYNALSLTVKGPKDASMMLEIQTKASCADDNYNSQWVQINGLTGSTQNISIALSSFTNANLDAVSAFVWSTYSKFDNYQFSNLQFTCSGGSNPSISTAPATTTTVGSVSTSRSVAVSSSTSAASLTARASSGTTSSFATSVRSPSSTTMSVVQTGPSSLSTVPTASGSSSIRSSTVSSSVAAQSSPVSSSCSNLLIDDWASQSRLTFLYYNAMLQPSSDDSTMKEITVSGNRVTLKPNGGDSYFYSKVACTNTQVKGYGGISLRIKAKAGTTLSIQLASSPTCGEDSAFATKTSKELGWTFNGEEKLYSIPFSKFSGADLSKMTTILFGSLSSDVTFGPMAFYCGNTPSEYIVATQPTDTAAVSTVPAPSSTGSVKIVDNFSKKDSNSLGYWHGGDVDTALTWGTNRVTIKAPDADFSFYTQLSDKCADMTGYDGSYLHVAYSGSNKFSIAMQQHNQACDETASPFPETWDSLEAARYATGNDIYIPISHFNIQRKRAIGIAFKGFYTNEAVTLTKVEIVPSVPAKVLIPEKLPSGNLIFACKRPNSIAFAIDDGDPKFAQEVMEVIKSENIKVTFFTVGAPLRDSSTNLSAIYKDMMSQGHQIALHSYTHPRMEGLPNNDAISWEYDQDIKAVQDMFGITTKYFRPPFGNEGARMRQQLVRSTKDDNPYIVNWNIDVEDWLYAQSDTPEKQLDSFQRDLDKGGSLVVMHYLYPSTVSYLRTFIQKAKATGKQLMRVDQCMMDPNAPPL